VFLNETLSRAEKPGKGEESGLLEGVDKLKKKKSRNQKRARALSIVKINLKTNQLRR